MSYDRKVASTESTYCRICEAACGLLVDLDAAGQPLAIRPDRQHPVSQGFVCVKGTRFLEVAHHPDRLLSPQRRLSNGQFEAISWAEANAFLSKRLQPILNQFGPQAVGLYFGNPLAFNALGALTLVGLMRALGSRNVFNAGSQDCNNKFAGAQILHGSPLIHPIADFAEADMALLLGTNPAVSQSSFVHLEGGARVFDEMTARGAKLVWVDPRCTESARRWGEHLPIRPGTDIFLLLTLLNELRDQYRPNAAVSGLETLLELADIYPVSRAAALTGLEAAQIKQLARSIRTAGRTTFHMSVGVNQGPFGTLCYVALQALAYLSGNLDQTGGLLFHPLVTAAAEAAQRLHIGTRREYSRIGHFPTILDSLPGGILADEILTPGPDRIRALIVVAGNPVKSIPGSAKLKQALKELDLLIGIDLFQNETTREADLLLPTTSWLERWDVATTTLFFQQAPLAQYGNPIQPPPGDTRSEAHILADLSLALGRPLFGSRLLTQLWKKLTWDVGLAKLTDLARLPFRSFLGQARTLPSLRPRPGRYLGRGPRTSKRQVRFWHPDLDSEQERLNRYVTRLESGSPQAEVNRPTGEHAFTLICRRRRIGHNSWLHGGIRDGQPEAQAWLAPIDLERLGLEPDDQVKIQTEAAQLTLPLKVDEDVTPGTIVVPHGLPGANINELIPNNVDMIEPISGQHLMTGIAVWLSRP